MSGPERDRPTGSHPPADPRPATMKLKPADRAGAPSCPFCGSEDTELMSLFGSSALTSQYYCRGCRSAFEQVKWGTPPPPADRPPTAYGVSQYVRRRADMKLKRPATMKSKPAVRPARDS